MSTDDDLDWEEFQKLSEEDIEQRWQNTLRQYNEMIDRMSPQQLYVYYRRSTLQLCVKLRKSIKHFPNLLILKKFLRQRQRRLLELRIRHYKGQQVGHG